MILFENVSGITSKRVSNEDKKLLIDVLKEELIVAGYGKFWSIGFVLDGTGCMFCLAIKA